MISHFDIRMGDVWQLVDRENKTYELFIPLYKNDKTWECLCLETGKLEKLFFAGDMKDYILISRGIK